MINPFFQSIEQLSDKSTIDLTVLLNHLTLTPDGLIPVITQDAHTKSILMMAWMNPAAVTKTLETKYMTYWSRSRQCYWVKGESSGHTQKLVSMSLDCDGDALLCQVIQQGAACHTGRESCFYFDLNFETQRVTINGNYT